MPAPRVVSVTVTVAVLEAAVVPTATLAVLQALMAAVRLVAKRVVVLPVAKVPVNAGADPPQLDEPWLPAVAPAHEKMLLELVPTVKGKSVILPGITAVTVTVLVLATAVAPKF
jgi:hypothetical protein